MLAAAVFPVFYGIACVSMGAIWPLWVNLAAWVVAGVGTEVLSVSWNVSLARFIRPDRLARVSAYDALGSTLAMPLGALVAGPLAARFGVAKSDFGAAVLVFAAIGLTLLLKEVWTMRLSQAPDWSAVEAEPSVATEPEPVVS
jgi:MFS family permease